MKKIWDSFFKQDSLVKSFGNTCFDYSKPDKDVVNLATRLEQNGLKTILDLGCGEGRNARYLTSKGFAVHGIDLSREAIKMAKSQDSSSNYFVGDMKKLPYPDDFFDCTISTQTIFHGTISEIRQTIREIFRVNRKGSLIFITLQPIEGNEYRMGRKLEKNTYISNNGADKGEVHHFLDRKEILNEFSNFKILDLHLYARQNYWYLLVQK